MIIFNKTNELSEFGQSTNEDSFIIVPIEDQESYQIDPVTKTLKLVKYDISESFFNYINNILKKIGIHFE